MFDGIENVHPDQRRGWTALVSFTLQAAAVAAALTIPLLYPGKLTDVFNHQRVFVPITEQVVPVATEHAAGGSREHAGPVPPSQPLVVNQGRGIHFPVPSTQANSTDVPPVLDPGIGKRLGPPGLDIGRDAVGTRPVLQRQPIISRPMQGYLIRRIEPIYPGIAKVAGVQGAVLIKAVISTEGKIEQAQVVSGSPLLSRAALDAIQQWRYRPYYLNDKAVEVETEITVTFYLTR